MKYLPGGGGGSSLGISAADFEPRIASIWRRLTLILLRLLLVASSRLPTAAVIFIHRLLLPSFFLLPLSTIHLPYPGHSNSQAIGKLEIAST
jgi:hypothetical protein